MDNKLLAISPLDGRYFSKLTGLNEIVSEYGLTKYRLQVELEWFKYLFTLEELSLPKLTTTEIAYLDNILTGFSPAEAKLVKEIEATTNHDVKAVEYYIKQCLASMPGLNKHCEFIHFACTSEDINNLSYALMLKDIKQLLITRELKQVLDDIRHLAEVYKNVAMMSHTHGQPATPTTMGKELYNVYYRLERQLKQLLQQEILGKMNGAVGNYNAHMVCYPNTAWDVVAKKFIEKQLGLVFNPFTTQIEPHDYIAEFMNNLTRINTILIDFARDIWGYIAINYFKQKVVATEVGSSTMPHKVNPIDFENGEGNLGLANSIATHLAEKLPISRWQRDLTDSTVLRNIGVVVGYSILAYKSIIKGMGKLELNQEILDQVLDSNWELLAEPIQMVMRKAGVANAYEQLKSLTRGKKINAEIVREFVCGLDISEEDKARLLQLTPAKYIGLANKLF